MTKAYWCVEGREFKPGKCIRISAIYFPFLKAFSRKRKNENDQGNGGFIDVTSAQLNFERKIALELNKTIDIKYIL